MKKRYISVAAVMLALGSLGFQSCIGSFALTNKVIGWNKQVGNKFVNELVFFAFWILPVYEVTALADLIVINSVEFWSGNNPLTASTKVIESEQGRYLVKCDGKGYDIIHESTGIKTRLAFDVPTQTWSMETEKGSYPFMTMVDPGHVKMITPDGSMEEISLDEQGLMAYKEIASGSFLAQR